MDPKLNKRRGFVFITFKEEEPVKKVLEKKFHTISGSKVRCLQLCIWPSVGGELALNRCASGVGLPLWGILTLLGVCSACYPDWGRWSHPSGSSGLVDLVETQDVWEAGERVFSLG